MRQAAGSAFRGWCIATLGREVEGIALIREGIDAVRAMGMVINAPFFLALLADSYGRVRQPQKGLQHLADALELIETTGERWIEAEAHRLRGKLLLATDEAAAAETSFLRAVATAQQQSAKLFELRASTNLARLWRDRGDPAAACDLLAPAYEWFTEGFDTRDLKEASALLDQLN
jgi:predicted ATPase